MQEYVMRYSAAAEDWNNAIPLGNGRMGAMVYGYTGSERIQLNEDSLWYGGFVDRSNVCALEKLPEIRQLIFDGRVKEAETLIIQYMSGAPTSMRHYEPLGELDIALNQHTPFECNWFPNSARAEAYASALDLLTGIHTITHRVDGVQYTREMFISYPDQCLCMKLVADREHAINLDIKLDRAVISDEKRPDGRRPGFFQRGGPWAGMLADENHTLDDHTLMMRGNCAGTLFCTTVHVESDGVLENPYSQLFVRNATEVTLYLTASTSNRAQDPLKSCLDGLRAAAHKGYDALKRDHLADFAPKMRRCTLQLRSASDAPTDQRIIAAQQGAADPGLAALYFMFGRYLLMSGGRENSAALNLQGIWNQAFVPFWDSKYTININTQMNYWPAEVTNLSETHASLFQLIDVMAQHGRDTARIMYGCRGTMCHHNTDLYGDCAPQDIYMASTQWVMGGAWLALHLWEHYRFTRDEVFLRKWYMLLMEHAEFFLDFLVDDGTGQLVTTPSLSPENRYLLPDGSDTPICAGPTMDNQILRALFTACLEAARILHVDEPLTAAMLRARAQLRPNRIGSQGQLLEWMEEVPEMTPGMGHISHLWGAYPGDEINWRDTPELLQAVKRSLDIRTEHGAGKGGWPLAWFICQYARIGEADTVDTLTARMVSRSGTRNFFNGNLVFQIDGNLGATAGIAEALLQSHTDIVHLLPALPPSWTDGEVKGLRARGGIGVDMVWENGHIVQAVLNPDYDGEITYLAPLTHVTDASGREIAVTPQQHGYRFMAHGKGRYTLS